MNSADQDPLAQPRKFLRYRSVRNTTLKDPEPQIAPPLPQTSPTSLTRLPSRYHRRPQPTTVIPPLPKEIQGHSAENHTNSRSNLPPTGSHPVAEVARDEGQARTKEHGGRTMIIQHGQRPSTKDTGGRNTSRRHASSADSPQPEELRRSYEAAREEARLILEGEADRLKAFRRQEAKRRQEQKDRLEKQRELEVAEEARRRNAHLAKEGGSKVKQSQHSDPMVQMIGQPTSGQDSAETQQKPVPGPDPQKSNSRTLVIGGTPPLRLKTFKHHRRASSAVDRHQKSSETHKRNTSLGVMEEARQTTPAAPSMPKFDAPVSAVNAGERRVSVKCKEAHITVSITPSTTTKDILSSASVCMSEPIDAQTAVVLESFSQLGLERPLRRYERIRDVMNSWDNDTQNHLFIMAAGDCAAPGLQVSDAPNQQPLGTTVHIYHSRNPGKWDKRWLRLREDGQITTSKHESSIDSTNICHLSDFDLYSPTTKQIKKLKPPKKLCFALKSQEKSSMFLDAVNFAHFFCTKDKDVADRWYQAVHSWRSWYLVNMLGEGQSKANEPSPGVQVKRSKRPEARGSRESLPYVLGSFQPLLDFSHIGQPKVSIESTRKSESNIPNRPSQSDGQRPLIDFVPERALVETKPGSPKYAPAKAQAAPPTAFPRRFMTEPIGDADDAEAHGFTGTGLLARSASRKSQGGSRTGHGVAGVEGKPLVDLAPTSDFTDGSLLRKMEAIAAQHGAMEPKIFRQKGREVDVSVGEGFN